MESFFHTLKVELVHRERFATREAARRESVRLSRGLLQSPTAPFGSGLPHARTDRAAGRLTPCPPKRGKIIEACCNAGVARLAPEPLLADRQDTSSFVPVAIDDSARGHPDLGDGQGEIAGRCRAQAGRDRLAERLSSRVEQDISAAALRRTIEGLVRRRSASSNRIEIPATVDPNRAHGLTPSRSTRQPTRRFTND